jgi:hypothetical protein
MQANVTGAQYLMLMGGFLLVAFVLIAALVVYQWVLRRTGQLAAASPVSTVSTAPVSTPAVALGDSVQADRVLSSQERPERRPLKRTTLAEIRAQYGYTVRVQRDTVPWSDALCAVILKARAGERVSREEWRTALKCSPNTLQKHLDAYQARQTVDSAVLEDAARAQRVAREISAPKVYPTKPKGVLEELPADVLQLAHT